MPFATSLIGGARRLAAQRGLTPEEQGAQQPRPGGSMGGVASRMASALPLFGGQMMQQMPQPPPPPQQAKRPSMWDGIAQDPLAFFFTGPNGVMKRQEEEAKQASAKAQQEQLMQYAQQAKLDPGAMLAMYANPEKFGESYATNYGRAAVNAGDSLVYGNGQETYRAPQNMMNVASDASVFNPETSGQVYKNAPSPKPAEPFKLGQGEVMFGSDGKRIAGVAPRLEADGSNKPPPGFASLPGGKLDYIPGGPADPTYIDKVSDARARGVPEFSQTEQRQYKSKVSALNEFEAGLNDYFRVLEENGGPQTIEGFWNTQQRKNIDAAHALMTLNLKQAYQGGALDKGLIEIAEKILTDPTGWSSFNGGGAAEFRKAAEPIYNNINYARSQIPEAFRGGAQPTQQGLAPPSGVSREEWNVMTPDEKALFQ